MTNPKTVAVLFEEEPMRWGVRGDPHLWREMREHFEKTPMPESRDELITLVEAAFERLTGHPISAPENFFVERFSHGGMSSGFISPYFWREKALPLISARYLEMKSSRND